MIFIIFILLVIIFNNWSVKKMKKNWKKLYELIYLVMFFLIWYVIDKMWGYWRDIILLVMLGIIGIIFLFIFRKFMECRNKLVKIKG